MLPAHKAKALSALKRLEGLVKKAGTMIESDDYCPKILEQVLAMQGHIKHIQGEVLESHLLTCAKRNMRSKKEYDAYIADIIRTIGLSQR